MTEKQRISAVLPIIILRQNQTLSDKQLHVNWLKKAQIIASPRPFLTMSLRFSAAVQTWLFFSYGVSLVVCPNAVFPASVELLYSLFFKQGTFSWQLFQTNRTCSVFFYSAVMNFNLRCSSWGFCTSLSLAHSDFEVNLMGHLLLGRVATALNAPINNLPRCRILKVRWFDRFWFQSGCVCIVHFTDALNVLNVLHHLCFWEGIKSKKACIINSVMFHFIVKHLSFNF